MKKASLFSGIILFAALLLGQSGHAQSCEPAKGDLECGAYFAVDWVDPVRALAALDKAVAAAPDNGEAYRWRGFVYYALGRNRRAISDLDKAIALNPTDAKAVWLRARALFAARQYLQAVAGYAEAQGLDPSLAETVTQNQRQALDMSALFGGPLPFKPDAEDLVAAGRTGIEGTCSKDKPEGSLRGEAGAAVLIRCARFERQFACYEEAVLAYRQTFRAKAGINYDEAMVDRGHGIAAWSYDLGAAEHLDRALKMAPQSTEALFYRSFINYNDTENSSTERLDRAIALQPDYAEAYERRALVRREAGDEAGAKADAAKAAALFKR